MTRPDVTAAAEEAYEGLGPWALGDDENGYPLLKYVAATADLLQVVDDLARDRDDKPGWAVLFDPEEVPDEFLDWLAQFLGVPQVLGLATDRRRARVRETAGFQRGTVEALRGAARQFLTGGRQVLVYERDGSPYRFRVRTYLAETPDPGSVRAALIEQKPAGLVLRYEVVTGATYADLSAAFPTYGGLDASFNTYKDMTLWIPGTGAEYVGGTFKVRI